MRAALIALPLILLAACERSGPDISLDTENGSFSLNADGTQAGNGAVSIRSDQGKLALKLPGIDAKFDVPGMNIGGDDMTVDGMPVHPGTKLGGLALDGSDAGGTVKLRFTDPAAPAAILAHYAQAAPGAGYAIRTNRADLIDGVKSVDGKETRFEIAVRPAGQGSEGTITITGN